MKLQLCPGDILVMLRKGITLFETVRNYEIYIYCYVPNTGKTCSDLRYLDVIPRFQSWTASINSPGKLKIKHWPVKQSHFMTGNPYFKGFLDKKSAKWTGWQNGPSQRQMNSLINIPSIKWIDQLVKHLISDWNTRLKNWTNGRFS